MKIPVRRALIGLVALSVVGFAIIAWWRPRPIEVETVTAVVGSFEEAIEDDGRARVRERVAVTLPWAGEIERMALKEGQWLEPGEVLVWVRPSRPSLQDDRTRADLRARGAAAQAAWQAAQRQAELALVAWQRAALAGARALALFEQGFISRAQVDAAALDLQREVHAWQAAQAAESVALHQLEQVRLQAAAYDTPGLQGRQALRATSRVQVLRVLQPHAAVLPAGTVLLEVGDPQRPEVVVPLLSQEALRLAPGGPARLSGWALDPTVTEPVDGRIRLVEPMAATKVSALGLEEQRVVVVVDPMADLPPGDGYRVRVRLVLQHTAAALVVPVSAVFPWPGAPQRHGVFRVEGDTARLVPVELRARGGGQAWIGQGLQTGDRVVVYPPAELADGRRVQASSGSTSGSR